MSEAKHQVSLLPAAARQLRKLDLPAAARITAALSLLAVDPRPPGAKAITARPGVLRVRTGDYRILYTVDDDRLAVLVIALGHRREIYR
jgi:mRNA interferase RelE/StbE